MSKVKVGYDEAVKLGLTKKCSKCGEIKSVSEFGRDKIGKYGAKSMCKKCKAKYNKQHYQEHREEINNRQRKYHQEHREEMAKYRKQYYQNNKEEEANRQRKYNQEHREEIVNYQKQYNQEHREEKAKYNKQYNQEHREEKVKYNKKHYQEHREEIANQKRQYRQEHREEIANYQKQYLQTPRGKENNRKKYQKRRILKNQSFYQPFTQQDKELCLNYFNHRCPYSGKPLTDSEIHTDHIVALSDKDGIGATAPWNLILCDASANMAKHNKPVLEFINSLPNPDEVYDKIRGYIILQAKRYIDIIPEDDVTLKTFNISFEELED